MANLLASKKDIPRNERNRKRNVHHKTKLKTAIKTLLTAIESKAKDLDSVVRDTLRLIDKTAQKGIIHKKTAARKKSKLMARVNKAK